MFVVSQLPEIVPGFEYMAAIVHVLLVPFGKQDDFPIILKGLDVWIDADRSLDNIVMTLFMYNIFYNLLNAKDGTNNSVCDTCWNWCKLIFRTLW